ncbi:phospho-2-dehydro-3-deoxyheptonate aldolase [Oleiphilus messinensis]|uniref:Phospho-2-dehydro-3-deoxyheptonate aldolase n=1 Tax=Oleiphilus messinensis TaxID=141451 RepID=A0A1Y0IG65_9GAMM|nr:3-deoxy-7-phosphoheptulonate synthase [Oleiphilus messinensis]ARU58505.1 phospho-2-dehydro-3-deoxyheptonate aldolase [Oleiphilus messinensis]
MTANMAILQTTEITEQRDISQVDIAQSQSARPLPSPQTLKSELLATDALLQQVAGHRREIEAILNGTDDRLMVITGPCSLHDPEAALEYGRKLKMLQAQVEDKMLLVMRCYFEKPRTTVGWKGMLYDPSLDGSHDMETGLKSARALLLELTGLGLPVATEALNPLAMPYLSDLLSWVAIGARTSESQIHREMVSGLGVPTGFKNGTDGSLEIALNGIKSAMSPHSFLGMDGQGQIAMIETSGNPDAHVVLRGGKGGPNYDADNVASCEAALSKAGLHAAIVIDCSHENSGKDHARQGLVFENVVAQLTVRKTSAIKGVMLESFLKEGRQNLDKDDLEYGVSITDACINWEETASLILSAHQSLCP